MLAKISSFSSRADEFEFQWWDHAFNKAAKSVKVEEGQDGQVKVGLPRSSLHRVDFSAF